MSNLETLVEIKAKLEKRVALQNLMKAANKIVNDKKLSPDQKIDRLVSELKFTEQQASEIIKPDYVGRVGFPTYKLSQNNQEINRLKGRMNELEKRHTASKSGDQTYEFDGGTFAVEYEDDRVKIYFDSIPDSDMRQKLKRSGWNWSPSNKAWQRKITDAAIYSAKQITGGKQSENPIKNSSSFDKYINDVTDLLEENYNRSDAQGIVEANNSTFRQYYDRQMSAIEAVKDFEKPEQSAVQTIFLIDGKKYDLSNVELPENHPIMILDRESPQWKNAVKEYFSEKNTPAPLLQGSPLSEIEKKFALQAEMTESEWTDLDESEKSKIRRDLTNKSLSKQSAPTLNEIKKYFIENEMIEQMTTDKRHYTYALINNYNSEVLTDKEKEAIEYFKEQEFIDELTTDERYFVQAMIDHALKKPDQTPAPVTLTEEIRDIKIASEKPNEYIQRIKKTTSGDYEVEIYKVVRKRNPMDESGDQEFWKKISQSKGEQLWKAATPELKSDYEIEKARQLEQGLIDDKSEGISILGMTKGKDNPVDKLRKSSNESLVPSSYENQFQLNDAIKKWLDDRNITVENALQREYTEEEKAFLRSYTGYGGLGKYDKEASADVLRIMEFYTPNKVIEIMWGLAYKHGYKPDMSVLETSAGTGEFLKYAKQSSRIMAFEISRYSSAICKILYPYAEVIHSPFEKRFIDKNFTIKDNTENLPKFDLCIGNPPYASFERLDKIAAKYLLGMGEQKFTKANNYVEYFLRRSLDMLKPNGLLIQIVGAELMNGGSLFLDSNNSAVKTYLAQNAELLEAYRLPAGIFETTNVTSEILVIRKNA